MLKNLKKRDMNKTVKNAFTTYELNLSPHDIRQTVSHLYSRCVRN